MTDSIDGPVQPGRPVRLAPTPPGFWRLLLGICVAALAPLFGFLGGSMIGSPDPGLLLGSLYWGLFTGFVIGGAGVAVAILGGRRLWLDHRARAAHRDAVASDAGAVAETEGRRP